MKASGSKQDSIPRAGVQFADSCIQIPSDRLDLEIRAKILQLGFSPQATGPHDGAEGEFLQAQALAGKKAVSGVFTGGDRPQAKTRGQLRGKVFHTVNRQINVSCQEGFFNLLDEKTLLSDLQKRGIAKAVAPRPYANQ
jgi:hypothetical protein